MIDVSSKVIRLMDCWGGFSQGFLETYLPGMTKKHVLMDTGVVCVCVSFVYVKFFFEELEEIATATCIIWHTYGLTLGHDPHFLDFC